VFHRSTSIRGWLAALGLSLLCLGCGHRGYVPAKEVTPKFGKQVVAEFELPQAMLDRFNNFKPSRPVPGESLLINSLMADTLDWTGKPVGVTSGEGPYTLVITLYATAKGPGDASSLWQAGWELANEQGHRGLVPGLSHADAKAGEKLIITAATSPLRFKSDQMARPVLGLAKVRNMEINAIRVSVVSGVAASSWSEWYRVWASGLVVLFMLVLWWFWFRPKSSIMG